jgi:hypothetical protein
MNSRLHSITSSARASSGSGTVRPSALAALRLMTRSNLVGCSSADRQASLPKNLVDEGNRPPESRVVVGSVAHESAGFYEALERIDDGNVKLARSLGNRIAQVEESTRQADDQDIRVIRPELRKSCLDTLTVVDCGSPFTLKVM